jgi:ribosome-associated protein
MRTEGEDNGEWIIVDCGAAVVHVMQPAIRDYYHLEEIWGDKPVKMKIDDKPVRLVKASTRRRPTPRRRRPARKRAAKKAARPKAACEEGRRRPRRRRARRRPAKKAPRKKAARRARCHAHRRREERGREARQGAGEEGRAKKTAARVKLCWRRSGNASRRGPTRPTRTSPSASRPSCGWS